MHKQHSFCSIQFLLKYLNVRGRFWKKNFCVLGISNYDSFFFQVRFLLDFVLCLVTVTKAWMIRKKKWSIFGPVKAIVVSNVIISFGPISIFTLKILDTYSPFGSLRSPSGSDLGGLRRWKKFEKKFREKFRFFFRFFRIFFR